MILILSAVPAQAQGSKKLVWLPEDAGDIGEYDTQIN